MGRRLTAKDVAEIIRKMPSTCDYCDGPRDWYTSEGLTLCDRHAQGIREREAGIPLRPDEVRKVRSDPNVINDWPEL